MAAPLIDTLLLFSLPASGKSELRAYLASLPAAQCRDELHLGPTLQLDDYPYVHLMHRVDEELVRAGWRRVFFKGPSRPFQDGWTWAALIELLNEDSADLLAGREVQPVSCGQWLMDRLDAAQAKVGLAAHLGDVPHRVRVKVAEAIEAECRREVDARNAQARQDTSGRTVVIECARGGPNGAAFPLTPPQGYATAFAHLSEAILERAAVLCIQVEPAESRRKNIERGQPDGAGSILHHSVPLEVMLSEYGTDDLAHLRSLSPRPDTITVERVFEDAPGRFRSRTFHLPVAFFDNRDDKTTFVRKDRANWAAAEVAVLHGELTRALATLAKART